MKSRKIRKILEKLEGKAGNLGLKFNERIFIVNFVTYKEAAIINYLTMAPQFNKFGIVTRKRMTNFEKFLHSKEFRNAGVGGSASLDVAGISKIAKLIESKKNRKMVLSLFKRLKVNLYGEACIATKSQRISERDVQYDVLLHEWTHMLLNYNKMGFHDTAGMRGRYNEGLTIFVEYYLGNYLGKDVGFLKEELEWVKKHGARNSFDRMLRYADVFVGLVEGKNNPESRRKAIIKYFKKLQAPASARYR